MTASDPGAGKRALVLFALALGGFAIGSTEFSAMSLLPFYARELGLSEPVAAHAISAYALGVVAGAPLLAFLGAGLPRRRLLVGLMIAIAAGNALTVWAPTYGWLLASRFVSGLPHGAYFGVAALMAASVMPDKRAQSVALVMLGLTLATIIGSPAANFIGLTIGWRWGFAIVVVLALLTALSVQLFAPLQRPENGRDPKSELSALGNTQVWLTLGAGAIGFGGMFAVYSFIAPLMTEGMGVSPDMVPVILVVFGIGMTVGNLGAGWLADRAMKRTAIGLLVWSAIVLAALPLMTGNLLLLGIGCFAIALGGGLGPVLQTRLMDVAGEAQTLAASLHHAAFNAANALGPFLAGAAISAGYGWTAPGWVGSLLAIGGLAILLVSFWLERRRATPDIPAELCSAE
ncbi:MFS transporter [Novosphingopyxis sp. YJ-S2-01]|uniref:MFS transporter n=1 Tax=Novosphingopyxis sp. YJ-S2-01 TaxID=2794021 RepID=UPI0018DD7ECB|nr:MFS transporter [Novosphingopyxis sp. YJ-S2-01]MBH9536546.1 MFS transporter [Novosphingopyxis sp. YJ-S2-01]